MDLHINLSRAYQQGFAAAEVAAWEAVGRRLAQPAGGDTQGLDGLVLPPRAHPYGPLGDWMLRMGEQDFEAGSNFSQQPEERLAAWVAAKQRGEDAMLR